MNITSLQHIVEDYDALQLLEFVHHRYKRIVFSSSLSIEDQVITDLIFKSTLNITIFTLDTGRLPKETYDLIEHTNNKYQRKIQLFFPNFNKVEALCNEKGLYSFYDGIEERKECCHIRKVEPLNRALKDQEVWITGLRNSQSVTRQALQKLEFDPSYQLIKANPLIDWSEEDVWAYIKTHNIPYNSLYDKGYRSIGCVPCTRAVAQGGDIRSGRWWWEDDNKKECGLHIHANTPNS